MDKPPVPAVSNDQPVDFTPRPAGSALTKTGGFLTGYSHTLQPYIGCRFGCEYCYVKGLSVHRFHQPVLAWGDYVHPRTGLVERLRAELVRLRDREQLDQLRIFMSSSTDPYQGLERTWRLTRACLELLVEFPPGLLVLQTRAPLVEEDFPRLAALGERCWLSLTLETDRDDVRRILTPRCPSIPRRVTTLHRARAAGLNVQVAVSPCLPYSDTAAFGELLLELGERVVVDTYTSGDGAHGQRTARTAIGARYNAIGWGDWRAEDAAVALFDWLTSRIGARAGWSQAGFAALTQTEIQ